MDTPAAEKRSLPAAPDPPSQFHTHDLDCACVSVSDVLELFWRTLNNLNVVFTFLRVMRMVRLSVRVACFSRVHACCCCAFSTLQCWSTPTRWWCSEGRETPARSAPSTASARSAGLTTSNTPNCCVVCSTNTWASVKTGEVWVQAEVNKH